MTVKVTVIVHAECRHVQRPTSKALTAVTRASHPAGSAIQHPSAAAAAAAGRCHAIVAA